MPLFSSFIPEIKLKVMLRYVVGPYVRLFQIDLTVGTDLYGMLVAIQ